METAVNLTDDRFFERQISTALSSPKSLQKSTNSTDGKELRERCHLSHLRKVLVSHSLSLG